MASQTENVQVQRVQTGTDTTKMALAGPERVKTAMDTAFVSRNLSGSAGQNLSVDLPSGEQSVQTSVSKIPAKTTSSNTFTKKRTACNTACLSGLSVVIL